MIIRVNGFIMLNDRPPVKIDSEKMVLTLPDDSTDDFLWTYLHNWFKTAKINYYLITYDKI